MRIAVSGYPGTGKTSLVKALSDHYQLPILKENMFEIGDINRKINVAHRLNQTAEVDALIKRYVQSFMKWDAERTEAYKTHPAFIADRWEADLLNYWLLSSRSLSLNSSQVTIKLFNHLKAKSKSIDFVVLTPLIKPFSSENNEEGNTRKKGYNGHLQDIVINTGLIKAYTEIPLILLPEKPMTIDERVQYIDDYIADYGKNIAL